MANINDGQVIRIYTDEYRYVKTGLTELGLDHLAADLRWGHEYREIKLPQSVWQRLWHSHLALLLPGYDIDQPPEHIHLTQEWIDKHGSYDRALAAKNAILRIIQRIRWQLAGACLGPDGKIMEDWVREEVDGGGIVGHGCSCGEDTVCSSCTEADQEVLYQMKRVSEEQRIRDISEWEHFGKSVNAPPYQSTD